jgi:hypothetical protein
MIIPHPESNLKLNPMVLGADIITSLKSRHKGNYVVVESVLEDFLKKDEKRTPDLFLYSLLFLFSIGVIEQNGYKIKLSPKVNIPKTTKQLEIL